MKAAAGASEDALPLTGPVAVLMGPPGAGKSTVGPLLAGLLGVGFLDTDSVVEQAAGKPVSEIFIEDGEAVFRGLERAAVARSIAGHPGILAVGGGAVMDPATQRLLEGRCVVYLRTGFAAAAHRTGLDVPRPLLAGNPRVRLRQLLQERLGVYEALASITVTTDDREPQQVADEVAAMISARIAADAGEGSGTRDLGGERGTPGAGEGTETGDLREPSATWGGSGTPGSPREPSQ